MYSDAVRRLVAELPNRGPLADPSHMAEGTNPICGDSVRFQLRVEDGRVLACRFTGSGCPGAVAAAAAVTELVEGAGVEECVRLDVETLIEYLGGLPPHKRHGAELAVEVLRRALSASAAPPGGPFAEAPREFSDFGESDASPLNAEERRRAEVKRAPRSGPPAGGPELDVVGIGAVSIDFVGLLEAWPEPGVKTEVPGLVVTGGGLVGTALTAVCRLGGSAAWVGKLGMSEMAERTRQMFIEEGVDLSHVLRVAGAEPHLAVVLPERSGRRSIFYSRRGVQYPFPAEIGPALWDRRPRVLLFDGGSGEAGVAFAREARQRGVSVVIDVETSRSTVDEALALSDHVVVPESFARLRSAGDTPRNMLDALRGRAEQTVVVSRGERGCLASGPEGELDLEAFQAPILDTTGCGDVFHGVYALALARGRPLRDRCVLASAAAALSGRALGGRTAIPGDEELRRFLGEHPPTFRS